MHIASPITITREAGNGSEGIALVDARLAASLIGNFFSAIELEGHECGAGMRFAMAMAGYSLAAWGLPRQPLAQDRGDAQEAHARIIDAASNMLAALKALHSDARPDNWEDEDVPGEPSAQTAAWRALDAAIALAEGRGA
jgi:hypothetical protein